MSRKRARGAATPSDGAHTRSRETLEERALRQLYEEKWTNNILDRMDEDQRVMFETLIRGRVKQVYVDIPAGYGKTLIAFAAGVTLFRASKVKRILYIRFPSKRGGKLGFLPGELTGEKEAIYFDPAYEALIKLGMQREAIDELRRQEILDFRTDVRLRGTNLEDAFVIVDEAQNAMDIAEMELVLGRFHDNVRAAIIGDSRQSDSNVTRYGRDKLNAFQVYIRHMTTEKWAAECKLTKNYRGVMAQHAAAVDQTLRLLEERNERCTN